MSALKERNERVKYAKTLGVDKPHTMKRDALEEAIKRAETIRDNMPLTPVKLPDVEAEPKTGVDDTPEEKAAEVVATREAWLIDAVTEIKGLFKQAGWSQIADQKVVISVGFPSKNIRKTIGQCHHAAHNGGTAHLFVNPTQQDTLKVLGIVAHELAHSPGRTEGDFTGHAKDFKKAALSVGLEGVGGKPSRAKVINGQAVKVGTGFTSTVISDDALPVFEDIAKKLGEYPHTALNLAGEGGKEKRPGSRLIKAYCPDEMCPVRDLEAKQGDGKFCVRLSAKWINIGMPKCPCGEVLITDAAPEEEEEGEGKE